MSVCLVRVRRLAHGQREVPGGGQLHHELSLPHQSDRPLPLLSPRRRHLRPPPHSAVLADSVPASPVQVFHDQRQPGELSKVHT